MTSSIRDIEQRNADLEALVFDLKMRLYYLTNRLKESNIDVAEEENYNLDDRFTSRLREHDFKSLKLRYVLYSTYCTLKTQGDLFYDAYNSLNREENNTLRRRQEETETELLQLRSIVGSSTMDFGSTSISCRSGGLGGLGPSVFDADYSANQLEENRRAERNAANAISQHDAALIAQLQEEVSGLTKKSDEDGDLIGELAFRLEGFQTQLKEKELQCTDLAHQLEESLRVHGLLNDQLKRQDALLESKLFKLDPRSVAGTQTSPISRSTAKTALLREEEEMVPLGQYSQSFTDFIEYKKVVFEADSLRAENSLLKGQLERERQALRRQEESLYRINTSAAELTLLESEEVNRLTAELERIKKSKAAMEKRCYEAEAAFARQKSRVAEIEQLQHELEIRDHVENSFEAAARQVSQLSATSVSNLINAPLQEESPATSPEKSGTVFY